MTIKILLMRRHETPQVEIPNAHDNSVWDLAWHPIGYLLCRLSAVVLCVHIIVLLSFRHDAHKFVFITSFLVEYKHIFLLEIKNIMCIHQL